MELKDFLGEFGESLRKKIDLCPVYDPANLDEWDKENLKKIERLIQEASRDDIPAQKNGILALAKGFYPERKRAAILVG